MNIYGKEVDPFTLSIESNMGALRIYIDMDIRNDIYPDKEYVVINEIKPLRDTQVINSYKNQQYTNDKKPVVELVENENIEYAEIIY